MYIVTYCNKFYSVRITVFHFLCCTLSGGPAPTLGHIISPEESTRVTTIVLCVFASAVVVFILYFLYRTYRRRVRERTVTYTAPVSKDFTVVWKCIFSLYDCLWIWMYMNVCDIFSICKRCCSSLLTLRSSYCLFVFLLTFLIKSFLDFFDVLYTIYTITGCE